MRRSLHHIGFIAMLLAMALGAHSQASMPDTVCVGTTRIYHVNDATTNSTYTWTVNGTLQASTTNSISVNWNSPGSFLITVVEHAATGCDGDMRSGYVYVKSPPVPNAGADAIFCYGTNQQLNGSGGTIYHWTPSTLLSDPDISNPVINTKVPGIYTYILDVSDNSGCTALKKDTVVINVLPEAKVFAGNDTLVVMNQPFPLHAVDRSNSNFVSYSWSPSFGLNNAFIQSPLATLSSDTRYVVTAKTVEGCIATDDISIKVFKGADVFVPTAFTPNGDGLNDLLKPIPVGIKELKYFRIFNRWGELVFTTSDPLKGWDGKYNGKDQGNFVFVWVAEAIGLDGQVIKKKGTVVVIK